MKISPTIGTVAFQLQILDWGLPIVECERERPVI